MSDATEPRKVDLWQAVAASVLTLALGGGAGTALGGSTTAADLRALRADVGQVLTRLSAIDERERASQAAAAEVRAAVEKLRGDVGALRERVAVIEAAQKGAPR